MGNFEKQARPDPQSEVPGVIDIPDLEDVRPDYFLPHVERQVWSFRDMRGTHVFVVRPFDFHEGERVTNRMMSLGSEINRLSTLQPTLTELQRELEELLSGEEEEKPSEESGRIAEIRKEIAALSRRTAAQATKIDRAFQSILGDVLESRVVYHKDGSHTLEPFDYESHFPAMSAAYRYQILESAMARWTANVSLDPWKNIIDRFLRSFREVVRDGLTEAPADTQSFLQLLERAEIRDDLSEAFFAALSRDLRPKNRATRRAEERAKKKGSSGKSS